MDQAQQDTHHQKLAAELLSGAPAMQLPAIKAVREREDDAFLEEMLTLYLREDNQPEVEKAVSSALVDSHYKKLVKAVENAFHQDLSAAQLKKLLTLCWENSMDFSTATKSFVSALKHEDTTVVIEAVTALEVAIEQMKPNEIRTLIDKMKRMVKGNIPSQNRVFIDEMISSASTVLQQVENARREEKRRKDRHKGSDE